MTEKTTTKKSPVLLTNRTDNSTTIVFPLPYWIAIVLGALLLLVLLIILILLARRYRRRKERKQERTVETSALNRQTSTESGDLPLTPPAYSPAGGEPIYENAEPLSRKALPPLPEEPKDPNLFVGSSVSNVHVVTMGEKSIEALNNPTYSSHKTILNKQPSKPTPVYDIPTLNTGGKQTLLGDSSKDRNTAVTSSSGVAVSNVYSKPVNKKNSIIVPGVLKEETSQLTKKPVVKGDKLSLEKEESASYKAPIYGKNYRGRIRKVSTRSDEVPLFEERKGSASSLISAFENQTVTTKDEFPDSVKEQGAKLKPVEQIGAPRYNVQNLKNELLHKSTTNKK